MNWNSIKPWLGPCLLGFTVMTGCTQAQKQCPCQGGSCQANCPSAPTPPFGHGYNNVSLPAPAPVSPQLASPYAVSPTYSALPTAPAASLGNQQAAVIPPPQGTVAMTPPPAGQMIQ